MSFYFDDSVKWFILNPFYIARSNLFKSIKKVAHYINWDILDFWCWEKPYQSLFSYTSYVGVDFENTGHDNSENDVTFYWDWLRLPFDDESFDSVISTEVFEHVFNLDVVIGEIYRVLKKDGKILISIPFCMDEHEQPYDFARYSTFGIKHMLTSGWFTVIKQIKTTNYGQTILQLNRMYLWKVLKTKNSLINFILKMFIIFPLHIIINLLSFIVPWNGDFYFNQVILAKKNEL